MDSSIFELYNFAIGPSSSHTVGPMRAAKDFLDQAFSKISIENVAQVKVRLFGSLAYTGEGHGTVQAVIAGLAGFLPEDITPEIFHNCTEQVRQQGKLLLNRQREINFRVEDITKHFEQMELYHPNTMVFSLYQEDGTLLYAEEYYSVGGGAIKSRANLNKKSPKALKNKVPYEYSNAEELFAHCQANDKKIFEIILANECAQFNTNYVMERLEKIYQTMLSSIDRGLSTTGSLPGPLKLKRRASSILDRLRGFTYPSEEVLSHNHYMMHGYVSAWALAVSEENAAFGKIITSPTCGSCGVVPAVLKYYETFGCRNSLPTREKVVEFLGTAAAIGILFKENASISGAEVGCQGEVGVACSMAAAALTAVLGGSLAQIEQAAKMGIIHFLGLTCDPIAGLVQVPCIERNAVAANQAVEIAHFALTETTFNRSVNLDQAILAMKQTGLDMSNAYKETSLAGLALLQKFDVHTGELLTK